MVKLVRNTGFMSCRPRFVDGMLSSNAQLVGVFGGMGLTDRQRWNVIVYTRFYDFGGGELAMHLWLPATGMDGGIRGVGIHEKG